MNQGRRHALKLLSLAPLLAAAGKPGERLLVSYNDDYAPYSWLQDPNLTDRVDGILPNILDPILRSIDGIVPANIGLPWRRAQAMVQQGMADALVTFASEERKQYAVFNTLPVVTLHPHLFFSAQHPRRAELERIHSREELMAFQLVDQKGNQWAEQNLRDFPKVEWAPGHDAIFRLVMAARGDLHVSLSPQVTKWRMKKLGINQEIAAIPAPYIASSVPFHFGIRKQHPAATDVLARIDQALAKPSVQQQIEAVIRSYG